MSDEERTQKIELYGNAYGILTEALGSLPREMWDYKISSDDWSVRELVAHITDSEANSYIRCRRLIAEPGSTVMGYDEMTWATSLHYSTQSTDDALELFKWLRLATYKLIKSLPVSTWANRVEHSESGTMTMDDWLDIYARHIPDHVEQMQKNHAEWKSK